MAEPQQLKLLQKGGDVWNRWRSQHPHVKPDLREAHLSLAILAGADLREANLTRAKLSGTHLRRADLSRANLRGADLERASLREANLRGANLREANLTRADLTESDLSGAVIGYTTFGDHDLSTVKGLETVRHTEPSYITINTIYLSEGKIPEVFMRGIGAPDAFIDYIRALVNRPFEYYTCFISYSNQDQEFAERLYTDLQSKNVRCWFAPEDLKIGDHYHQRIDESIRLYDKLVLILSEHAIQSAWVEREVVAAREKEDRQQRPVLFPLRLDDAVMDTTKSWAADVRRRWHIGDFTQWKHHDAYQQAFERLLHDLKAERKPAT